MKKDKIFSIIIAVISFLLFFMPIGQMGYHWMPLIQSVIASIRLSSFKETFYLFQLIVCIIGLLTIAISIVNIVMSKKIVRLLTTIVSSIYVAVWFVMLFASFSQHIVIYEWFTRGKDIDIIWLLLYFVMLLGIIVLNILPYIPPRRPSKTTRMQEQIDELQKQVDELKNDK